jgi:HD-like signal output (HDOD) protein
MNVFSKFGKNDTHGIFDLESLWFHSIACATTARDIAKKKRMGDIDKIFLAALLHDMGKVILAKYLPDEYCGVYEDAKNTQTPLFRKEKEALGLNHAELSGLLMKRWKFPDDLLLPCLYHHRSQQCPPQSQVYATVVELSDHLCMRAKMGRDGNGYVPDVKQLRQRVRMSTAEMDFIVGELENQRANIQEFLEVMK